ncbi:peptidoglycan recognition protein family protein [Eudoraea chungangensis]|uniref:peptidoglycan recognition protein family protein n=1 Tax=Eudoraea chungangensis TaxID=1481905 RepID=UPI0023ED0148|nr:peptidoglycan recognition family protein [Eudoraea chungangensis]
MKKLTILFLFTLYLTSCSSNKKIIEKPIIFDAQRTNLTKEYLLDRYGIQQDNVEITPKMIVLHWTVIPSMQRTFDVFNPPTLPDWRPDINSVSGLNVSSQFLVDRDGTIYQLLPETTMARHVIGLNHCAIGIENVGGTDDLPLTDAQLKSNIWLVKYLSKKYAIDYLIGHYEYTLFEKHPLWLEKDDSYRTKKDDPGKEFMLKVRNATKKLNFKPLPTN